MNVKYLGPPAVVIHGPQDLRLVLAAMASHGRAATLLSASGAACFAGVAWWRALMPPGLEHMLDCADAPGRALEALAQGQQLLRLAPCPAWDLVAARAGARGAKIFACRPPALSVRDWLG